jgi:hypothetical protein
MKDRYHLTEACCKKAKKQTLKTFVLETWPKCLKLYCLAEKAVLEPISAAPTSPSIPVIPEDLNQDRCLRSSNTMVYPLNAMIIGVKQLHLEAGEEISETEVHLHICSATLTVVSHEYKILLCF